MPRQTLKHSIRYCVLLAQLLVVSFPLFCQRTGTLFTHYNIQNGLIMNNVEYIYVDMEGFVWMGTYAGLQRFDGYEFRDYTYEPGNPSSISDNFISTIFEDRDGNLWVGTEANGLNLFDKELETFRNFRHDPENSNSLASNGIPRARKVIAQDDDGFVWINTEGGLNRIDPEDLSFESYYGDFSGQLVYDRSEKALWIAGDRLKRFDLRSKSLDYYDAGPILSIILDSRGKIWLGTESGVMIFDRESARMISLRQHLEEEDYEGLENITWFSEPIGNLYEDFRGNIWFSIRDRLCQLDRQNRQLDLLNHEPDNENCPTGATISGIYGNKKGIVWISYLNQGVSKLNINLKNFKLYRSIPGDPNSLSGNAIRSIFLDEKQYLWVGTYDNGLNRIDPVNNDIRHFRHDPRDPGSVVADYITAIYVDSRDRLWIGSFINGICHADDIRDQATLRFRREDLLSDMEIHEFTEDPAGKIWISTQYGMFIYDGKEFYHYGEKVNQLPELRELNLQSVVFEPPNLFWLATWSSGVCKLVLNSDPRLAPETGRDVLLKYDQPMTGDSALLDNKFIVIHRDDSGTIWLGSFLNGLIKIEESGGGLKFTKYDKSAGAPDNSIYGLTSDGAGNLWLSTNKGLGKFDPATEQFRNYTMNDGLQSNSFMWDAYFKAPDGQLFFGGINGLNAFYPEEIVDNPILPEVFISKLIINNEEVRIGDEFNGNVILTRNIRYTSMITLSHRESVFSLQFTAMDNINPWEVMYRYRLEGFDEDWIQTSATGTRTVRYTNLNPGTYTFQVMASNSDGIWNEDPATLQITVLSPWWKTWYAILIYALIFALLLVVFRKLILGRAQLIHEAKMEHLEREKTEQMSQMKLRFFTSISHEFRTPLTLILGPLNKIIQSLKNDERFARQIMTIRRNSDRLFRLIDQVIEFRKIETNKIRLNAAERDIVSFVRELVDSFEEIASQRSIELDFITDLESRMIWFDENKVDKIVYNLLSNAFKFTPDKGRIEVRLSGAKGIQDLGDRSAGPGSSREYVRIEIEDNGIGISEHDLEHIFDRYYRVENPDSFVQTGSGIGLSLARELTELHGGQISVSSRLGKGSCFAVYLPCGKEHLSEEEIVDRVVTERGEVFPVKQFALTDEREYIDKYEPLQPQLDQSDRPLLLIVDDDPELRAFIKNNFRDNFIVIEAENGEEGFEMALKNNPDIIISDIMMPVLDGIDLCRKIKTDIKTSHIPLILLTAKGNIESKIEGLDVGADAYISKPFTVKLIEAQISNIFETRQKLRKKFSKELILQPSEIAITSLDAEFLQKAIDTVEKHISDTEFTVDAFIHEMGMSRSRMHRKIKALTAQSTSEFIRSIRLKRSLSILEKSQMSIEEVAYSVGFNSTAYFTKCFRSQFGKTPTDYIKFLSGEV